MDIFDKTALLARAFEEIDRVKKETGASKQKISLAIDRHKTFFSDLKTRPDTYSLTVEDLIRLNAIFGVDDIYIIKGIRYKSVLDKYQVTKDKLDAVRTLLNSI